MSLNSIELEKQLLAGLIKHPEAFIDLAPFIDEDDFDDSVDLVNKTIFTVLKHAIENGTQLDHVGLSERINSLGLTFDANVHIGTYVQALDLRKCPKNAILSTAKDLKNITIRRNGISKCREMAKFFEKTPLDTPFETLINSSDKLWNEHINTYDVSSSNPENLFADMEEIIEERGNNPVDDFGLTGPHKRMNEIYGNPCQAGNIMMLCARSGVGKTQFTIDLCLETSKLNNNVPVLHLDNGEMSKSELQMRLAARESGVPMYLLQTGKWRQAGKEIVEKVRATWATIQNYNFNYFNVGGINVDEQINLAKRFYYSKVGRGNEMIINFDYIKSTSENFGNKQEYQVIGDMCDKWKRFTQDFRFDGEPVVSMVTSVQSNRSGISSNRPTENIIEDESVVSLSDRVVHAATHLYFLRKLNTDELISNNEFGTHRLVMLKHRHLGENPERATTPIRLDDGSLAPNALFFNFDNFHMTEVGDLQDLVDRNVATLDLTSNEELDQVPDL